MSASQTTLPESAAARAAMPNGPGGAALLAAGIGAFGLALLDIAADHLPAVKSFMIFYKPTGPLSGVTTSAIVIWLVAWAVLEIRWKRRTVALKSVTAAALVLLLLALVLTFPPVVDLF